MTSPRFRRMFGCAGFALAVVAGLLAAPRSARAQEVTASAGNVTLRLTVPEGVTKIRGILAFTSRGLAGGWAKNAAFRELATRLQSAIVLVQGGDDGNDDSYPGRCASGEFNGLPDALTRLAAAASRPELAHAPLVAIGHSHGGDYWNWFNACHPERIAAVFVHASGGVNYTGASLKTPVIYELGTNDLIENGSKKPRAGMFANRSKGATMSLVIGAGEGHNNVGAGSLAMIIDIIEGTFRLRVPADADPAAGPVRLNVIDEAKDGTWVGDLYTKEIAPYATFTGNKAHTAFLPSEAVAQKWKATGPALPMSIALPAGTCSWCGDPRDEPKEIPTAPPSAGPPGGPVTPPATGTPPGAPPPGDPSAPSAPSAPATPPPAGPAPGAAPPGASPPPAAGAGNPLGPQPPTPGTGPRPGDPAAPPVAGGCTLAPSPAGAGALPWVASWLALALFLQRRRCRR